MRHNTSIPQFFMGKRQEGQDCRSARKRLYAKIKYNFRIAKIVA